MNAEPLLTSVVAALTKTGLETFASKRSAARARDKAVLEVLEKTLREKNKA